MTEGILRTLTFADIAAAQELSTEAGWNQTADDWRMLIELAPRSCWAIETDGTIVSTTTLVSYARRLAWVGMVLTRIAYRGRGLARRLLDHALAMADQRGVETVKLDATDQGRPLYEKLGFRAEQVIERWEGTRSPEIASASASSGKCEEWKFNDQSAFGADRMQLLEKLARRNQPFCTGTSYLLTRPGRVTAYLGPCVAETSEAARILMQRGLLSGAGRWSWDLLTANTKAVALARELGFAPSRHLVRMVRGKELRGNESLVYAIAGFELG